ncbi:uncharacterized protein DNG_06048 [Cephalotrichum gorgonifer]|uniref:Uncharacterized protein n=1 Tax=Cephalotrichum gorgonifer TaxID=2041049 RepID=A0AAE8MZ94_9PEZI|nr:uncharacterized protein DNG_06048 [Cephalotrichum gorgonifer]
MRLSTSILMAMPLAAYAAEEGKSVIDEYKAKFDGFLGSFGAKPVQLTPEQQARYGAEEKPVEGGALTELTLGNWKETLYSSIPEGSTTPEDWWVFVTGRGKSCNGFCLKAESAFNQTAETFAAQTETDTPNMALINCDNEPILCSSWSCGPGSLWVFDLLPAPADVDVHLTRVNLSSITPETFAGYLDPAARANFTQLESVFHPFNSNLAKYDLAVPFGYAIHYISKIPNWAFMFGLSAISRTMMTNRMQNHEARRQRAAAPPATPAVKI